MDLSRREFLWAAPVVARGAVTTGGRWTGAQEREAYSDPAAAADWITKALAKLDASTGPLHLGRFADPMYYLLREIAWTPEPGQKVAPVRVPVGFVTDFASIPRAFWRLLPPDGTYTFAAILHDYLYWEQLGTRADADLTFKYAMEEFQIGKGTIESIYAGVRLGGGEAWASNASLRRAGEKRLLKRFPTDPKVRWDAWRRGDVFD